MVSVQRILFMLGFAALGGGIALVCMGAISARPAKTAQSHKIDETILVPSGSDHKFLYLSPEIIIHAAIGKADDIRIGGTSFEIDNLDFNFYLLTQTDYGLWKMGKSYTAYFEGENRARYDFTISPRPQDFEKLLFLVKGENRAVRVSATVRWMETDILGALFNLPAMVFLVYGLFCTGGGLILIFLFREKSVKASGTLKVPPQSPA